MTVPDEAKGRACVFCGGPANSSEHAFPQWLNDLLPADAMTHRRTAAQSGDVKSAWVHSGFDFKVKQVCRQCNNGWMSRLEDSTKELLIPLLTNERTHDITPSEQTRLAIWGYKTAIVLSLVTPADERVVPSEHFEHLYHEGAPPNSTWVWIGGVQSEARGEVRSGWSQPERLVVTLADGTLAPHPAYRLSFSAMALFFQVVHDPGAEGIVRPKELSDVFIRVRPISKGSWPPGRLLTLDALDDMKNGRFLAPGKTPSA